MAEIALARHKPRVGALQYAAAAQADARLLPRAVQVAHDSLQPTLALRLAQRWVANEPQNLAARRAAAAAALSLHDIALSADYYRFVVARAPGGVEAAFAALEKELRDADNIYGVRQLADRLAAYFPDSYGALRLQGYAAMRANDPAAAARSFASALGDKNVAAAAARRELTDAWRRARVLAGDADAPIAESMAVMKRSGTSDDRFDYALLLVAAKRNTEARAQLRQLSKDSRFSAEARRVLGLLDFQEGKFDAARTQFTELLTGGRDLDDAFYYLGLIADRHGDLELAVRCYARVQTGDEAIPALLRAAAILRTHGQAATADQLLDQLQNDQPDRAPEIIAARAEIEVQAGDARRAQDLLDQSLLQYPDSTELRYARASIDDELGDTDAALRELAAVLASRPTDPMAMNALGYTLADHTRRLGYARKLIESANAAAPKDAAIRDSLGWVLYRQGHAASALPYLSGAYADDPGGDIGAHWGEVLWQLGKHAEAEHVWLQAAAIDPDDRLLKATRRRLQAPRAAGR